MSMSKSDLENLIAAIHRELQEQPKWLRNDGLVVELCRLIQGRSVVTEYVNLKTLVFYESYCRFEIKLEPLTAWAEIKQMELLLPYSSIVAIDRRTMSDNKDGDYHIYRMIIDSALSKFYVVDEREK